MQKVLCVMIVIGCLSANAQWYLLKKAKKESKVITQFQKDENGKIIFYGVVEADSVPRDTLWKNAKIYLKSIFTASSDKIVSEEYFYGTIEATTSYDVFLPSIISKIPHGNISYTVTLDVKDRKYRYTFSNFVFRKFKQDRDLKYKLTKYTKPLEEEKYFGSQSVWNTHRADLKRRIEGQIAYLKKQMVQIQKPGSSASNTQPLNTPVIKTADW